ncbi:pilus assembly protein [Blastopirellula sp. J2-11]|uniref:TadE/TadG family type IV pilus assembly protein n=1 Tax=Blastopirellula sp. J2-11 TaxID=2943192 RepID=UPI0021CA8DE4|nr:TadE family protein [Blastopirellula sp. J2-11]UUO07227.1 pilus assembly protein [Blastopirellula sp. J2-11]
MQIPRQRRQGTAMIEGVFCLVVVFFMLVGMLEFGVASLRRNLLRDSASRVARAAVLRGEKSDFSEWGPNRVELTAAADDSIAVAIRPSLATMAPEDVRIIVDWLDGDNLTDQRVNVIVEYDHDFLFGNIWMINQLNLKAETQMRIER